MCRCRQAMKGGAVEFVTAISPAGPSQCDPSGACEDSADQEKEKASSVLKERFEALSGREREIMLQVAQCRLSKQIAGDLGISETTVNVHRSNLMHKMKAASIAELGRMADKLNLVPDKPPIARGRR